MFRSKGKGKVEVKVNQTVINKTTELTFSAESEALFQGKMAKYGFMPGSKKPRKSQDDLAVRQNEMQYEAAKVLSANVTLAGLRAELVGALVDERTDPIRKKFR